MNAAEKKAETERLNKLIEAAQKELAAATQAGDAARTEKATADVKKNQDALDAIG